MSNSVYTFICIQTGESQDVHVCQDCARDMPLVDGERVRAEPSECDCEFCGAVDPSEGRA